MRPCRKCCSTKRTSSGRCEECRKRYDATRYVARAEKVKAAVAKYRAANREKTNAASVACHKAKPHIHRAASERYRKAHKAKCAAASENCRKSNPAKYRAYVRTRQAARLKAIPLWVNPFFIEEIYDLADMRTKATGLAWQVDHIVPLQSKLVCGLHWELNLQVIPELANKSKGNRWWPDMPA